MKTINKTREVELRFIRSQKAVSPQKEHIKEMINLANNKLQNQNGRLIFPQTNNW